MDQRTVLWLESRQSINNMIGAAAERNAIEKYVNIQFKIWDITMAHIACNLRAYSIVGRLA